MKTLPTLISGDEALARGVLEAGVSLVTGYPGAPVTAVVSRILQRTSADEVTVMWNSNEKVALEMAFGASVGGTRALLCVKSVGLNIALDPLMAINLTGCNAGLVILVGDDPGGWGSQNEQDSRALALVSELPMLEPTSVSHAHQAMRDAFQLSESLHLPVFVRVTRALTIAKTAAPAESPLSPSLPSAYQREFMQWVVLPINVVPNHQRLFQKLEQIQAHFETSPFNRIEGEGTRGVIAAGFAYQKLINTLGDSIPSQLRILRLGTFHPLPATTITDFLRSVTSVLIVEETAPWIENATRALAQRTGLPLPIYGRDTGHLPRAGELFTPHIATALNQLAPDLALSKEGECTRPMPSRQPLCEKCPYIPTFDALTDIMDALGGRDAFIVVGDPGCMVRGQLPPYTLLDVKNSLGSSIGMGAGLALSQQRLGTGKRVIALTGDSSFLHSGFAGLVDATKSQAPLLVIVLDNGTTALSGGQPHPASQVSVRGQEQQTVSLAALARESGAARVSVINLDRGDDIRRVIERGLREAGVTVIIARGRCQRW